MARSGHADRQKGRSCWRLGRKQGPEVFRGSDCALKGHCHGTILLGFDATEDQGVSA